MRVCRRCGIAAAAAALQAEAICSDRGLVAAHSYVDLDIRPDGPAVTIAGHRIEWEGSPAGVCALWLDGEPVARLYPGEEWTACRWWTGDLIGAAGGFAEMVFEVFDFEVEGRREWLSTRS